MDPGDEPKADKLLTPEERRSRKERTALILSNPELLEIICGHVANGGTLLTLVHTWDVRYSDITNWLDQDKDRFSRYMAALAHRGEWAKERYLKELRDIALVDVRQLFKEDGGLKDPTEWPANLGAAVASIEVDELFEGVGRDREKIGFTKKVRFWSKVQALESLCKNLGILSDVKVEHHVSLEALILAAQKPKEE